MRGLLTTFRILVDVALGVIIYKLYLWGVKTGVMLFKVDFWFTRLTFGIIGVGIALALFAWAKNVLFYVFKCCDIYLATDEKVSSVASLFSGVVSRFGSVIAVPIFNHVIRSSISELSVAVKNVCKDVSGADTLNEFLQELDGTLVSRLAKCGKAIAVQTFSYADECVLSYCFANKDKNMGEAAIKAMAVFVKNLNVLLPKMFTVSMMTMCLRVLFYFIGFIIAFAAFGGITITTVVTQYVILKAISFTAEDAIIEPIVLRSIVEEFNECDDESDDAVREELFSLLPSLEGLTKMKFRSR